MDIQEYQDCLDLLERISIEFDSFDADNEEDQEKMEICMKIKEIAADTFRRL